MRDIERRFRMRGCPSRPAFGSAKRAVLERSKEVMPAPGALRRRYSFKRNDAQNFLQARDSQVQLFERVILHSPHPLGSRCAPQEIWFETATQDRANGFVHLKEFVNSDASLVPRVVAE